MQGGRKTALLICYYFPPLGLAGVGRPLHLVWELPAFGWDCHVLTVKPVAYRAYEPELLEGLDKSIIHRSGSRDPQRLMYLLGMRKVSAQAIDRAKSASDRFFPDSKIGWVKPAVKLGRKLCRQRRFDA
ncbi:glycosyl transferase family 1, partial [candidate division GN15 bacterium]|nr:glycosyl transferase family 1 [candidate division GN15 bacterium]